MESINHANFLRLAIPFTLSTVTQPLLGAVDTAVVGHLDSPAFIGGVAIGTVIFNTLYWLFGFLRVATSGFSAQTLATAEAAPSILAWLRPLSLASGIGLLFIAAQQLIIDIALQLYGADLVTSTQARHYFDILIWAAPLVLIGYVNLGWLMGRGHVREVLWLQIGTNSLNILLDYLFVTHFHAEVAGVAWATLISQSAAFVLGLFFVTRQIPLAAVSKHLAALFDLEEIKKIAAVNRDLFIRTACLLTMTNIFVARGSSMGADILAANAILFQIQYLIAYLFDGLANAASVFAGRFTGAGDKHNFVKTGTIASQHLIILSLALLVLLPLGQNLLLSLFTDLDSVLAVCNRYFFYLWLFVLTMPSGLVYYGFYVGATCSGPVRNSLLLALALFLPLVWGLIPLWQNHGLWSAFIAFCGVRSLVLLSGWTQLQAKIFPATKALPESVCQATAS